MKVESIKFSDEIKVRSPNDIEFYGETDSGKGITCRITYLALGDYFGKSINESFEDCFSRELSFIRNLARGLVYCDEINVDDVYLISCEMCLKYKHIL